jgi:DNA-binding NtrC family response regulator
MSSNSGLCVLIIDDNAGSLELLESALAQPGIEIITASDPHQGLDLVASRHPQIVLTDLLMPGMTGLEVLSRIMEMDPSTDVVLMTAHYSTETAVEAIKWQRRTISTSPFSPYRARSNRGISGRNIF